MPSNGFEITFEMRFSSNAANGLGLLYFDSTNHESLDLNRYSKAWLGAGTCVYARQPGGACQDLTSNAHAAWGFAAPTVSGLGSNGPIYNGCDQALVYFAEDGESPTKQQREWDGTQEECDSAMKNTWVTVRLWLMANAGGNFNIGVELDMNGTYSEWSVR